MNISYLHTDTQISKAVCVVSDRLSSFARTALKLFPLAQPSAPGSLSEEPHPGQWWCLFKLLRKCKWDVCPRTTQGSFPCLKEFRVSPVSAWNQPKEKLTLSYRLTLVHTRFDSYQTWHAEAPEVFSDKGLWRDGLPLFSLKPTSCSWLIKTEIYWSRQAPA